MPLYTVKIPCTASIVVTVEAPDKNEAKRKALGSDFTVSIDNFGDCNAEIAEFERHEVIDNGMCFHGVQNVIEVEEETQ